MSDVNPEVTVEVVPARDDRELYLLLGRIDGKLDQSLSRHDRLEKRQESHEIRLSSLEKGRAWFLGAVAAVAFGINYAYNWIVHG